MFALGVAGRALMETEMQLVKYEAACNAIEQAKSIDEVKEITNQAEAARAYARQAKNRQLELDALEIRVRAERRLGQILIELKSAGVVGSGRGGHPVHMERDLGVDANTSGAAQRLAKLPSERFTSEMSTWRDRAEVSQRVEVPLQRYRIPSSSADHQRAAARRGRSVVNQDSPLDKYRAPDGRRMCDWRVGELTRIKQLHARVVRCVDKLLETMPVANPDPLDTMEMVFRKNELSGLFEEQWKSEKIHPGSTMTGGLQ